jgi:hypothetical protein
MFTRLTTYLRRHHIGLLALCLAMSGTAYAASLPRNSVGTKQLRNNAVTSAKVKNRSLRRGDFARGQLPAGARGPQGPAGPQGASGATNVTVRSGPMAADTSTASCNPGERATGGGGFSPDGFVYDTTPTQQSGTPTSWQAQAADGAATAQVQAWVICAAP